MTEDEKYMTRCIQLAQCGRYHAAPNPMVGAVIVCDGRIIGEGYHIRCGGPHAEVNAVRSVHPKDKDLLQRATIYVSLEPCSHYGKTPPCADLIISCGIPRVVVGCVDPFSEVSGRGIQKLRDAGISVTVGVLEQECLALNRRFIVNHTEKRPYVILKWAQSSDRFVDRLRSSSQEAPVVFSTSESSMLVHRQRAGVQAIMVGRRTALLDNPSLTVRHWPGDSPLRIVIDRDLSLPEELHLFDGTVPTLVFTACTDMPVRQGVEFVTLDFVQPVLPQLLTELYARRIQSLLVEGGAALLQSFIDAGLWDEAHVETAPFALLEGVAAPVLPGDFCGEVQYIGKNRKDVYRK
ncbi:MAG: bifunctional diaminohydroxyphosphoribosylaminopyrimidine deaminase/5-amino-6-(5-phosphoribosylamino)uracil reductase RibD [Bacteroidaceae bacterium]|nr:bifunctional diaminohydroxyphosphoribosylaminopyrimidine deaminase/5-amino-6-(5-phosphoribosylamino)uracil reductase RibD [Bacteroidaceae bacterium]MBQ6799538.1 bifunctional diaminohydroxyphosphoribosylaminopyrimidine deaminase/5-amino-6-(5-phosphoribosylamino)uracil reductase RibD [Bacteroidaceae bacterium]